MIIRFRGHRITAHYIWVCESVHSDIYLGFNCDELCLVGSLGLFQILRFMFGYVFCSFLSVS